MAPGRRDASRPSSEVSLDEVEGPGRRDVADDHEDGAVGRDPRRWGPGASRERVEDLVGPGDPPTVGVVAVPTRGPDVGRRRGRLGQLETAVLGQARQLALDPAPWVGRSGQHLAEDLQQPAELGCEGLTGEGEPVGVATRPQPAAHRLQRVGELLLGRRSVPSSIDCASSSVRPMSQARRAAGHPQPDVDQRHRGTSYGDHPQTVAPGPARRPAAAGAGGARPGPGRRAAPSAGPGSRRAPGNDVEPGPGRRGEGVPPRPSPAPG